MHAPFKSRIEIPERFRQVLAKDVGVNAPLEKATEEFSVWLGRNQTIFFPEYTDHGIDHVTNVLISSERLISEAAWTIISPADVCAIVASVLLHDCAMHITQDGFFELVEEKLAYQESRIFSDERTWKEEFDLFQQEAARWDSARLVSVFGDPSPAALITDSGALSDRQKLLVGEFLRRHHARIAHQIALNSVPGRQHHNAFSPFSEFSTELRDLYGFLARSHNLGIREAADKLHQLRRRTYLNVHGPFVMAVLRIADYIQIDAARAPTQILQLRGLKSPISRYEWAKHQDVLELHQDGDDPEALNVIAEPKSVEIFSGLRKLFKDLQREMDESWALLGEVYGRFGELKHLGLTVRRLVSNLDNAQEFEARHKPAYVPRELKLTTANAELLELLVGPLYGNRPSVGARELLQNAIDATLERSAYTANRVSASSYVAQVEVEVEVHESGSSFLRVSDNGVGMTLDTIDRYFLRAGASFRKSKWWKSEYLDDEGRSCVRRSGRFGIGVLAAFLIGGKVTVSTRHVSDHTGNANVFELAMDGGLVEVTRRPGDVGTTVTVEFSERTVVDALLASPESGESVAFSDWFIYGEPHVRYRVFSDASWTEKEPKLRLKFPLLSQESPWVPVEAENFGGVYWSFEENYVRKPYESPQQFIACNGIFVMRGGHRSGLPELNVVDFGTRGRIRHPPLLVDDPEGRFPLNIQRSGLAEREYPFQDELVRSIASVYARSLHMALHMESAPENLGDALDSVSAKLGYLNVSDNVSMLGVCDNGWIPLDETILSRMRPRVVAYELFPRSDFRSGLAGLTAELRKGLILVPWLFSGANSYSFINLVRSLLDETWGRDGYFRSWKDYVSGYRFFVRDDARNYLAKKGGLPKFIWRQLKLVHEGDDWTVYDVGDVSFSSEDAVAVLECIKSTECRLLALQEYLSPEVRSVAHTGLPALSPFAAEWIELVGNEFCLKVSA